ncbi:hypothetical protein CkaCkLH20_12836 [Colletotrichum karsti]|uniref:Uncharacterized protein n=1 Tax=Colletotrichum karsti TaxID=1095194 RepID=A0A9P6HT44_9PEZI|nr:uncharacterized protein CkaCkLH20_12836 [Colletotrichum karsti]KAF9869649.1 hypothetical protein CkaCkLH20_12836 [Colletotrichum karsti]
MAEIRTMDTIPRRFIQKWRANPRAHWITDEKLLTYINTRKESCRSVELFEELENAEWAQRMRAKYGPRAAAAGLADDLQAATSYNGFTTPENYRGFLQILQELLDGPYINTNDMVKFADFAREWIERVLRYVLKVKEGRIVVEHDSEDVYLMEEGGKDIEDLI